MRGERIVTADIYFSSFPEATLPQVPETYSTKVVESIGRDDKATRTKQERVDT